MLKGLRPPRQPALHAPELLPDPWDTPTTDKKTITAEQICPQPDSFDLAASSECQRRLPAHQAIAQDLLEDELKLKANLSESLKDWLEKALALLYWLETEGQAFDLGWQPSSS